MGTQAMCIQAPIHASLYEKEGCILVYVGTKVTFLVAEFLLSSTSCQHQRTARMHPCLTTSPSETSKQGIWAAQHNFGVSDPEHVWASTREQQLFESAPVG
jgi:hypothetical protein